MYQNQSNAIQRARIRNGLTQEALAERAGYSADNELLPDFEVGKPLAQAAAGYINCILDLIDNRVDRKLLRLVAHGKIDEIEQPVYEEIMQLADRANKAYYEMRFAK